MKKTFLTLGLGVSLLVGVTAQAAPALAADFTEPLTYDYTITSDLPKTNAWPTRGGFLIEGLPMGPGFNSVLVEMTNVDPTPNGNLYIDTGTDPDVVPRFIWSNSESAINNISLAEIAVTTSFWTTGARGRSWFFLAGKDNDPGDYTLNYQAGFEHSMQVGLGTQNELQVTPGTSSTQATLTAEVSLDASYTVSIPRVATVVEFFADDVSLGEVSGFSTDPFILEDVALPVGTHKITAVSHANGWLREATSTPVEFVSRAETAVTLYSDAAEIESGTSVTVTASVSGDTPSGSVTFLIGADEAGEVAVVGGTASLTLEDLEPGSHEIFARYSGDDKNRPSATTAAFIVTVKKAPEVIIENPEPKPEPKPEPELKPEPVVDPSPKPLANAAKPRTVASQPVNELAQTGSSLLGSVVPAAVVMLLAGGIVSLRRKQTR